MEDRQPEDLEVQEETHPEGQGLPHPYHPPKAVNNPSLELPMSNPWEDYHKSSLATTSLQTTSLKK